MFVLIVDDFGIEYVGDHHLHHLRTVLTNHYTITEDLDVFFFPGIDLKWNYTKIHAQCTSCLSMDGYIANLLLKYGHKAPTKHQLPPHRHREINYGSKEKLVAEEDTSPKLNNEGIKRVQDIVGALLYYAREVHKRLLLGMSAIGARQASATEQTTSAIKQILDYVATYPNDGITYRSSDIILAAHPDAGFNNESKARSRAGAHIFLSENAPTPEWNGAILTIAQIIKFLMSSAAEAELCALYITAKEMVAICQTLI